MSQSFASQVAAITPLGDAIDGSPRTKPRRQRKPPREPLDRSHTFFCSNPQCDHSTWAPAEQARHMAREFWEVSQALIRLAPESPEALKLTGGVILRDLTCDDLLAGIAEVVRCKREGLPVPTAARLRKNEYVRRSKAGELEPPVKRVQRQPRKTCKSGRHPWIKENIQSRKNGSPYCRLCQAEKRERHPRKLAPCGTPGAYQRHRLRGEDPCDPCRQANTEAERERKRAKGLGLPEARSCARCSTDISQRGSRAVYCEKCAADVKRERKRSPVAA